MYSLEEVPQQSTNIFWGEMRDDIVAVLDSQAP